MRKNKIKYLVAVLMLLDFSNIFAQDPSIGSASVNITQALDSITDLVLAAVSVASIAAFFAALMRLYLHRKNPQQVPISQFFSMLAMSLALIGLPFLMLYGDTAYKILKNL